MRRDIEKEYGRKAFVAKLRRLADALERGERFVIHIEGERLTVPRNAAISVEHERAGDLEEVEFQVRWRRKMG